MLDNMQQLVRQEIVATQASPCAASTLSMDEIFRDVIGQLIGLIELVALAQLAALIPSHRSITTLKQHLAW